MANRWDNVDVRGNAIKRFNERYIPEPMSGCWLWAHTMRDTYGSFRYKTITSAHRASYELFVGPVDGKHVLHKCDNPCCVNPDHLFLGTQKENMHDMHRKKRYKFQAPEPQNSRTAKLSWDDVEKIRQDTRSHVEIARDYGVTPPTIQKIRIYKTWKTKAIRC